MVLIVMWFFISTVDNSSIDTTEHSIDSSLTNYGVRLADTVNRPQLIADCTAGHDITVDVVTLATPETAQVATIECKAKNGTYEPIVIGLMPDEGANPSVP